MKNSSVQFQRTTLPLGIVGLPFTKKRNAPCRMRVCCPMKTLFTILCALLVSLTALTARAQTATVIDPQGDAFYSNGKEAPAFLDILVASFTISDTLTFTVDVAGSLDALPNPSGSAGIFAWHFPLNTDPSTNPGGFPVAPGQKIFTAEFYADAQWDGTAFSGVFVDRRPLLTGGTALQYSIPVSVSGSRIILTVPAALAAQVRAAVMLPGATWNCSTVLDPNYVFPTGPQVGDNGFHEADTIGRQPWPQ
jgi:hypothetical protein